MALRLASTFVVTLAAVLPIGCGSGGNSGPAASKQEIELKEIHELYMAYTKSHQKPPAQFSDFPKKDLENLYPSAQAAMNGNKYVIVYGVSASDSSAVIAYEKDGGAAITAGGNIKTLSADEAKALKK
jgi:hypothetical protein